MSLGIVILAAGQGTRMKSDLPKVLHRLAGRPLLRHVLDAARRLDPARIAVVYGHGGEAVPQAMGDADVVWVEQAERLGTGHAVTQAMPAMAGVGRVMVLYGDVPLIGAETLRRLLDAQTGRSLALLTAKLDDPTGYGRIVRDPEGRVLRIVEQKDAQPWEIDLREINTGFLAADRARLEGWLGRIGNRNAQGEYYLTDVVGLAAADGLSVATAGTADLDEVLGVNDRLQLAHLERRFQRRQADALMRLGVTLLDPERFDLRGTLEVGRDVEIDCNVILEGRVSLGDGVRIGANSVIRDARIGAGTRIKEHCVIEEAEIGPDNQIGPFARVRPETTTAADVHLGNFVEIKKSEIGSGSKVNHLSYIGDATVGSDVNIGAGTITCNYDGANKHRTIIGDRAFIGSDTQLVAPVRVGEGATIGAGTTVTRDAPAERLTLSRTKQTTIEGWRRPVKRPK